VLDVGTPNHVVNKTGQSTKTLSLRRGDFASCLLSISFSTQSKVQTEEWNMVPHTRNCWFSS
jgi:hypothetical protein